MAVAGNARSKILAELVDDFVEERVRQFPAESFTLALVKRALQDSLKGTEAATELTSADDRAMVEQLDRHPFLIPAGQGSAKAWKPGLDRGAGKRRPGRR
jgi:hypothetical protein